MAEDAGSQDGEDDGGDENWNNDSYITWSFATTVFVFDAAVLDDA